jgi:RimJ/RimL family protein N-acetyltransferase
MTAMVQPVTDENLPMIVDWLVRPETAKWLDFGPGQGVTATALKVGIARGTERIFTFSDEGGDQPIGVVGLSQVDPRFRTAMLWYALGDREMGGRGLTTRAVGAALGIAFDRLELDAINAWTVAENRPSEQVLRKTGFQLIGRQRRCHYIGDQPHDRLLFDRLSSRFDGPHV